MLDAYVCRSFFCSVRFARGEYAVRVREPYRLSHFHMNNIGYCVSHECLSFILIPLRKFSCTQCTHQSRFTFSMRSSIYLHAVGLSSRRSTAHHPPDTQNIKNNNNSSNRKLYRVHRTISFSRPSNGFRFTECEYVRECECVCLCFEWNRRAAANSTANSQLF